LSFELDQATLAAHHFAAGMAVLSQRQFPAFSNFDTKQKQLSRSKKIRGMDNGARSVFAISLSRSHAQSSNFIAVWLPWRVGIRRQVAKTALQYWPI
jgi:hypothetical protein